ncbi:MAG: hypothetical protein KDJ88_07290 [Bauldia sp.]|nr:hypothetical protein [Bauldia sp.]
MTRDAPTWEVLNAYVDGALAPGEAAAVAEAAGDDPQIADQIACLYRLKGVMPDVLPAAPSDLRDLLGEPRRRRYRGMVAAAVLVIAAAGTVWLWMPAKVSTGLPDAAVVAARVLHDDWLAEDSGTLSEAPPSVVMAALSQFHRVPVIPDLSSAKLTIERVTVSGEPDDHLLQIGYRGNHGCHLSLFVFAGGGLPEEMARQTIGTEEAYGWQVDELGYLLFAKGMDPGRLAFIAREVEEATRSGVPFDERARQALAENKAKSASCVA